MKFTHRVLSEVKCDFVRLETSCQNRSPVLGYKLLGNRAIIRPLLEPQPRFGDQLLGIRVNLPLLRTAVPFWGQITWN